MADYLYLDNTGVVVPDTSAIMAGVVAEYKAVFGADLVTTPDTPQGSLIVAETLARTEVVQNNAALANQINPNLAGGVFLDAIMALTGMQRQAQTPTIVAAVTVTGVAGTVIPQGVQAQTTDGDVFETREEIMLDGSGNGLVDFQSAQYGPIPCDANTLTQIVTGVIGWETVNNTNAGTLGTTTQSDQSARALRNNTLAFQGIALAEAITSALYATANVRSLSFQENVQATTQTINAIAMVPHSVYACVQGGTDLDVATALLENKSSGAAWNGGTTVNVTEPSSGQSYAVKFDRPSSVSILINVSASNITSQQVIDAVLNYAAGNVDGMNGFVVGQDVSPFEIAGAITRLYPAAYVSLVEISLISPSFSTNPIPIGVNEVAYTQSSYITPTIT